MNITLSKEQLAALADCQEPVIITQFPDDLYHVIKIAPKNRTGYTLVTESGRTFDSDYVFQKGEIPLAIKRFLSASHTIELSAHCFVPMEESDFCRTCKEQYGLPIVEVDKIHRAR